ncbi:MAG: Sua5/YciO/YrdC/YwlC family protein, partial [Porticoccaceae bacterium]|nr:Sua5/YciO/YrdC/YwlC family protein [Porticoccaceae bacterium]
RILKANTPGPYTFLLAASSELPRRLVHSKRKTVGIRVPKNTIVQALLEVLGGPLMSMTFALPEDEFGLSDPYEIKQRMSSHVDAIVDGGYCGIAPTTVIDLTDLAPRLVRQGMGDFNAIG